MTAPSTMVNEPMPGKTNDFKVSVPVAVAFIRQTLEFSKALCPWSPHSLSLIKYMQLFGVLSLFLSVFAMLLLYLQQPIIGIYIFGLSLLCLLVSLGISFWEISISVKALQLHLSDLTDKKKKKEQRPFDMMKYKQHPILLQLQYEGGPYFGFASQAGDCEDTIEKYLFELKRTVFLRFEMVLKKKTIKTIV
jgi:hypothetical protein